MWNFKTRKNGTLSELSFDNKTITMQDEYQGPAIYIKKSGEEKLVTLHQSEANENIFEGILDGLSTSICICADPHLHISLTIKNTNNIDFDADSISLRLGISHYMEKYPQWNDMLFPTLLRCEENGFWGYFMSPNHDVLAIACAQPVRSWKVLYNKVNENNYGHRIYTTDLVLFSKEPQPTRHTKGYEICKGGQTYNWDFHLDICESENSVPSLCSKLASLPIIQFEQYSFSPNSIARGTLYSQKSAEVTVTAPDNSIVFQGEVEGAFDFNIGDKIGLYNVEVKTCDYEHFTTEAKLYVLTPFTWYMQKARENAILKPQKASTHLESWYGFFSIFLADKHFETDAKAKAEHKAHFDTCFNSIYGGEPVAPLVEPERLCNTAVAISLLVDAYEAYGDISYVEKAIVLGDWMVKHQIADGSYRAYLFTFAFDEEVTTDGIHYTSVIYAMKSMLELVLLEEKLSAENADCKNAYTRHFESVKRAADNLVICKDNIDTEGEITFEDGMISCSALQLGQFALYLQSKGENASDYIQTAVLLFEKHKCLQQRIVPDCRRSCATLRFWEAQYDILLDKNMINSPHGWTSWKNYASYYLYLLTGEVQYLLDTMNCLGACMQMIDAETGDLRWAFICDASVRTKVWHKGEDAETPNKIETVIGEQYMNMISGWWKVLDDKPVGAYPLMPLRIGNEVVPSKNIGGCCDNDVHEHFKCMEEVVLTKAYVAQGKNGNIITYNCTAQVVDNKLIITPAENIVSSVHINVSLEINAVVEFENNKIECKVSAMQWIENNK